MVMGFWKKLKKPIIVLAPLANVTDAAFRHIIAKYGKPDIFWTEFVSADGLCSKQGREKLLIDLKFGKDERPIVAQLFTGNPEKMREAAKLVRELGFDGLDINMGCPDRAVERQGAGAALIKTPKLAQEVIRAALEGAGDLPVSVKTRIGYNKNELETWLPALLECDLAAVTLHARTRKEMSAVPAHWDSIKRAVEIRDASGKDTLILGNGDVLDIADAKKKVKESGADGVMLGRAIFGNPWLFSKKKPSIEEKLKVLKEHSALFNKYFKGIKNFAVMKKHFKAYVSGFDGAKELRAKLMEVNDAKEVGKIIDAHLKA